MLFLELFDQLISLVFIDTRPSSAREKNATLIQKLLWSVVLTVIVQNANELRPTELLHIFDYKMEPFRKIKTGPIRATSVGGKKFQSC